MSDKIKFPQLREAVTDLLKADYIARGLDAKQVSELIEKNMITIDTLLKKSESKQALSKSDKQELAGICNLVAEPLMKKWGRETFSDKDKELFRELKSLVETHELQVKDPIKIRLWLGVKNTETAMCNSVSNDKNLLLLAEAIQLDKLTIGYNPSTTMNITAPLIPAHNSSLERSI